MTASVCGACRTPVQPAESHCPACGLPLEHDTWPALGTVRFTSVTSKLVGVPLMLLGLPVVGVGLIFFSTVFDTPGDAFGWIFSVFMVSAGWFLLSSGWSMARNQPRDLMNPWALLILGVCSGVLGVALAVSRRSLDPLESLGVLSGPAVVLALARLRRNRAVRTA